MLVSEIKNAIAGGKKLVWNDPAPIEGNDYTISYIEDLSQYDEFEDEELVDCAILIQYNDGGSEAEVLPTEISFG